MSENFTIIVSTRLTKSSVDELDRVRGRWTRADAVRELATAGMRLRHPYNKSYYSELCRVCDLRMDSVMHLTFQEQDEEAMRGLTWLEMARVDHHAEG